MVDSFAFTADSFFLWAYSFYYTSPPWHNYESVKIINESETKYMNPSLCIMNPPQFYGEDSFLMVPDCLKLCVNSYFCGQIALYGRLSCLVWSCWGGSCLVWSCVISPWPALCCIILSCVILSCLVLSCLVACLLVSCLDVCCFVLMCIVWPCLVAVSSDVSSSCFLCFRASNLS